MKAFSIIAYTFKADIYCPDCIPDVLPTGPGEDFDGWALAPSAAVNIGTEENLDEIASAFGIERYDESTFDSDYFPKVIFASDFERNENCGKCGREIP